jgi:hypothetical protein
MPQVPAALHGSNFRPAGFARTLRRPPLRQSGRILFVAELPSGKSVAPRVVAGGRRWTAGSWPAAATRASTTADAVSCAVVADRGDRRCWPPRRIGWAARILDSTIHACRWSRPASGVDLGNSVTSGLGPERAWEHFGRRFPSALEVRATFGTQVWRDGDCSFPASELRFEVGILRPPAVDGLFAPAVLGETSPCRSCLSRRSAGPLSGRPPRPDTQRGRSTPIEVCSLGAGGGVVLAL